MEYFLNNREVEIDEIDFEPGEGVNVIAAKYVDTGEELTDEELDKLGEHYAMELYEDAYVDAAARAYDRAKDAWKDGDG